MLQKHLVHKVSNHNLSSQTNDSCMLPMPIFIKVALNLDSQFFPHSYLYTIRVN